MRNNPPATIAGEDVIVRKDYKTRKVYTIETNTIEELTDFPVSNVLQFILRDKSIVSVRPSGTEPKIKFYASCCSVPGMELAEAISGVGEKIKSIEEDINGLIAGMKF
jgi:phosphoglucomutase